MVEYMQPVLCQCKPNGDDIDIDILRNNLSDILTEEIKVQKSGSIKRTEDNTDDKADDERD